MVRHRRELVAQRLATARREDRQDVVAGEQALDDLPLVGAEGGEAELASEERVDVGPIGLHGYGVRHQGPP